MAKFRQFLLLIWKNWKLQIRHPWVTLLELGVPAFFSLILVLVRSAISSEYVSQVTVYEPFGIDALPQNLTPSFLYDKNQWTLLFTPNTPFLEDFMKGVCDDLKVVPKGFDNETSLEEYYSRATGSSLAGVVFDDTLKDGLNFTSNLTFTIRPRSAEPPNNPLQSTIKFWFTDRTFPLMPALGPRNRENTWGGNPGYMSKGFLPIQHAISKNFMKLLDPDSLQKLDFDVLMNRYPYPPFLDDRFVIALSLFFPMIICFSFIYPAANIVKNIVVEKENKIKEAMKMMGLSKWLHWTAWYLKYLLFLCISCMIITFLLCLKFKDIAVINQSDPFLIFLWLLVYTASFICFCFLLSTLFNKGNSAAAGAGVICFLTFVPYFFIVPRYQQMSYAIKIASCLLPNLALSVGSIVLTTAEAIGNGLQWDNFSSPPSADSDLAMSTILVMLVIDGIIYLILTWYIDAVYPGEYGVPERWYFFITRSYWFGNASSIFDLEQFYNSDVKQTEFFENDPEELMPGIQILNLTKVYGKAAPAVNNININMFRGHITALLGHNGAGKTTTISMLTGLITPTSGTAIVNGCDIREDMDSVHSNLGICPQHDILFNELTVEEHLYFFCKLKGYLSDLVNSEIERIISCLSLEPYRKTQVQYLSGGWKRKISVGIAFVGGSRIVILDEPTSGMDAFNRRALWEVLEAEKEDRTILLTTHFMEEADALGDRIAIMADGEIQCCGSPIFLKKKYGAGYHLTMVKEPDCDTTLITKTILSRVPNAEETSNIGRELKYSLPTESSHLFCDLFTELDQRRSELKISSYGASITTMEEVFIKVGNKVSVASGTDIETPVPESKESLSSNTDSGIHENAAYVDDSGMEVDLQSLNECQIQSRNSGWKLYMQHLRALLEKRILHSYRNIALTISQLFLPPMFLILTMIVLKTLPKPRDAPPLPLGLYPFRGTEIPYAADASNESQALSSIYASQFQLPDSPVYVNKSMTEYLLSKGKEDIGKYNMHNMIGAKFEKSGQKAIITSLFNNKAYHTPAIALLEIENALLKYFTNESYTFSVTNFPMPRTIGEKLMQEQTQATESYQISQDIMFGMSFLIASFAVFIVKERASNSKHLQRVSGMSRSSYWLASFLWDFLNYMIPCCLVFLVFIAFKTKGFSSSVEIGRVFVLFFIHGFAVLPFVYCCTFAFYSPSTAYVRISIFNILAGIALLLTVTILEIPDLDVSYVAKPLDILFSILLPNYALGRGVSNLYQNNLYNELCNNERAFIGCIIGAPEAMPCCKGKCKDICVPWEENYFTLTSPGIGTQLICLSFQAILFTVLLVLCEMNFARYIRYLIKSRKIVPTISSLDELEIETVEDDDVRSERLQIHNTPLRQLFAYNHLVVIDLVKKYGGLTPVNKVSFGVQKGECFGLLGANGAGKTTTFKMITGDVTISSGEIYVDGFNIKKQSRKVQGRIGYCPQFDALIDELTGRETLTLFSRLRGIPNEQIAGQIKYYSELLTFNAHVDKLVKHYSGGNKRKLSTAVALVGDSPVIFLDEPTTGMDPVSRRSMWGALLQVMQSGRSVILTSHSMEECEALCTRLVIMVNGRLCCLGSPQHLKTKFGRGFTLTIKVGRRPLAMNIHLNDAARNVETVQGTSGDPSRRILVPTNGVLKNDIGDIKAFVMSTFVNATLRSAHENQIHFHIASTRLNWAEIFGIMERAKVNLNIEDYTVGETTLEQVFLNFASAQRPDERL
ncbi:phospholipid-transporting ATPase ABCA3 [Parasteatoda tepidariorum]|uniref:phospholipid-transporting ATPase ABCA3 n=1 Tax=Parasteatoda tepidariorum TaxID=114398 RepID=UPI001C7246C3|nr:phospholipid-transporting ATPase ABCA3 [Parasteatoda tepidariorum]